jgi:hypothetical protein
MMIAGVRGVEEFFVREVRARGEVTSLFRFATEFGFCYRYLLECAHRAETRGLVTRERLLHRPGRPNCYRPAEELSHE